MYVKITRSFLESRPKKHLLKMFRLGPQSAQLSKKELVSEILSRHFTHKKLGAMSLFLSVCEYCRADYMLGTSSIRTTSPIYCVSCGRTSPYRAFQRNLERTALLMSIGSSMRKSDEKSSKAILLEQALVTVITSFEVFLRDVYSLVVDHKHVIFGESIYARIYDSTRNEFLGLGTATSKFKKEVGLNLKEKLGQSNYSFLSKMYSARHIIVHNCSIKDKDYISQTGEEPQELNKKLSVSMRDLDKLMSLAKKVGILAEGKLRERILAYHRMRTDLIVAISDSTPPSNNSLHRSAGQRPSQLASSGDA
jgi:hypothetical protein